jgi:outer membrane protein assembly factor BamB
MPRACVHRHRRARVAAGALAALVWTLAVGAQGPATTPPAGPAGALGPPTARRSRFPSTEAAPSGPPVQSTQLDLIARVSLDAAPAAQAGVEAAQIYVPLKDGRLVALDLTTSRVVWSLDIPTAVPPATGEGLVFVAGDERLTAVSTAGAVRWSLPLPGGFSAPPLWDTGWLLAGTASGDLLCLRGSDGQVLWTRRLGSPVKARPALGGDRAYVSLDDGRVVCLNLHDGAPVWEHRLGGTPGPLFPLDDRVFVGSRDKFFYCLDTKNGKQRWRWRTGGTIVGPAALDTKRVYFTALDNVLRALDRENGSQKWMAGLPLRPTSGPLLLGDAIFVGGVAAELRAYVAETGVAAGQYSAPSDLAAPPQLVPGPIPELNGILLLTRDGEVQLLRRRLEPAIVPLVLPIGVTVPLTAPPVPVSSAAPPEWEPSSTPLEVLPGTVTAEPGPPPDRR